jgi:membrane protease YdiL (CAAX protease family)
MAFLPIFGFSLLKKQAVGKTFKDFKLKKTNWKVVGYSLLLGVLIFIFNMAVSSTFNYIISLFGYETTTSFNEEAYTGVVNLIIMILTTAVLPGICEEIMHRGMILQSYKTFGVKNAIVISSLLFGLMHLNISQFFYATIIGFIIAIVDLSSDNIIPGIIIHFVNNALSVYFTFAYVNNWVGGTTYAVLTSLTDLFGGVFGFIFSFLVMCLVLVGIIILISKVYGASRGNEFKAKANRMFLKRFFGIDTKQVRRKIIIDEFGFEHIVEEAPPPEEQESLIDQTIELLNDDDVVVRKISFAENIFLIGVYVMAGVTTLFTFIWGIL